MKQGEFYLDNEGVLCYCEKICECERCQDRGHLEPVCAVFDMKAFDIRYMYLTVPGEEQDYLHIEKSHALKMLKYYKRSINNRYEWLGKLKDKIEELSEQC